MIFSVPNVAGKSTHADAIVAALDINTFVDADYMARGLSGRSGNAGRPHHVEALESARDCQARLCV